MSMPVCLVLRNFIHLFIASLRYVTKLRHINYDIRRFDNAKGLISLLVVNRFIATPDHNNTTDDAACTSHLSADDKQSTGLCCELSSIIESILQCHI